MMMSNSEVFGTYLFSYNHAGSSWVIEVKAQDADDAKARIRKLHTATYDGEMMAKVSMPRLGLVQLIAAIWQRLSRR